MASSSYIVETHLTFAMAGNGQCYKDNNVPNSATIVNPWYILPPHFCRLRHCTKFHSQITSDMCDCQTYVEEELATDFVYVLTTFPVMYVAAVREEPPCEYEARNTGHAVAML